MNKEEIKKIFGLVLVDHNIEEFFKYCTDDFKLIYTQNILLLVFMIEKPFMIFLNI